MDILSWNYEYHYFLVMGFFVTFGECVIIPPYTVAVNNSVSFPCTVVDVNVTLWALTTNESIHKQSLSSGITVFNNWTALNITTIPDVGKFTYNLLIPVVSLDMEGQYDCSERGENIAMYVLQVEVPPVVRLKMGNDIINGSIDVIINIDTSIQCVAEGGNPSVSLRWEIDGREETIGIMVDETNKELVTSTLTYRPKRGDKVITCTTNGHTAIPNITVQTNLHILYKPTCSVRFINNTANVVFLCLCNGNPTANISILANGSIYANNDRTTLSFLYPVNLSCSAVNLIGTARTAAHKYQPQISIDNDTTTIIVPSKDTPLTTGVSLITVLILCIVGIIVICVVLVTLTLLWRRGKKNKFTIPAQVGYSESHMWNTMSDRPPRPPPTHTNSIIAYAEASEPFNTVLAETVSSFVQANDISPPVGREGSTYNQSYASIRSSPPDKEMWNISSTTGNTYNRIQSLAIPDVEPLSDHSKITGELCYDLPPTDDDI